VIWKEAAQQEVTSEWDKGGTRTLATLLLKNRNLLWMYRCSLAKPRETQVEAIFMPIRNSWVGSPCYKNSRHDTCMVSAAFKLC